MLAPDFPLHTSRLLLRPYTPADLDFLHQLESNPELLRYVSWLPRDIEQVRASLAEKTQQTSLRHDGDDLTLLMLLATTGERVGDVQLTWASTEHRQGEIGFITHPDHTGRGYATEAAHLMLRLGFDDLGLHRISASLDARNTASARVAQRLGMTQEAHLHENTFRKGEWTDEAIYAVLADQWRGPHQA
ncbi:GNAT family N-acetyltransferase [Kineococcus sp. GCM10028916]|uniref:GNAT family N-acetyltransferase n=1 Tax=Kineococcus sp. GCM10028916 TaxID=3273394 RepID=UPI003644B0B4